MADEMKATPVKNKQAAGVAGALQGLHSFVSKPFGYDNPPGQMLSQFVGIPDIASALERIGYGEPLTTGSGQTLKLRDDVLNAIMAVAPFAQATKGLPVGAATKSPIAIAELEKLAKIKAEMAAKNAADEALKPQYNEAVKGQTKKQKPLSFEQWKAINYPEGTQGLQNVPQKQTFKYPQESLPAEEREENLQKFLGNSRIRDRLYHATPKNFSEFKPGGDDPTISGPAIWLTPNATKQPAAHNISSRSQEFREGTNVMPVYVQARSPLMLDDKLAIEWAREVYADGSREFPDLLSPKTIEELKKGGYDSIIHADPYGNRGGEQEIIMFEPNKIKSAIGNRGTYDINEADITKARGGSVNLDAMYMAVNDAKFRRK
jgi:hypothetical protein